MHSLLRFLAIRIFRVGSWLTDLAWQLQPETVYWGERVKRWEWRSSFLVDVAHNGIRLHIEEDPLPDDAIIVGAEFNAERDTVVLYIESETYDEVTPGEDVPRTVPSFGLTPKLYHALSHYYPEFSGN